MNLAPGAQLLRLVRPKPDFVGDDDGRPRHKVFEPSSDDRESAKSRGLPIRVSVWDLTRISVRGAREAMSDDGERVGFTLTSDDVKAVSEKLACPRLRAVDDPIHGTPEGHSGIEGLDREQNEPRLTCETRLRELAQKLKPLG